MKTQLLTSISALTLGLLLSATAQAGVSGASSNTSKIRVGGTEHLGSEDPTGHIGSQAGSPGIGVHTSETAFKKVSLNRLEWMARFGLGGSHNLFTGVTKIDEDAALMPTSHGEFGHYAFKKVSGGDASVYFGEWTDENDVTDGSHTVYYVGKDKTTAMPTSGSATYKVKGINDVRNAGLMKGKLKANFGTNKLTGKLKNSSLTVAINSNINTSTASFSGSATANDHINDHINGHSKGEFFGNNAAALGGIATFKNNSKYDTAFAGTK